MENSSLSCIKWKEGEKKGEKAGGKKEKKERIDGQRKANDKRVDSNPIKGK